MKTVKLVDSTFSHENAIGLSGQNSGEHPASFRWDTSPGPADVKVWTDIRLAEAVDDPAKRKIGLIVESPVVARKSHMDALKLKDAFDVIFTHNQKLVDFGAPFAFYPLGGSRIKRWDAFSKSELVSLIVGRKRATEGQRLRHRIAEQFNVSRWGVPYTEYQDSKIPMLRPYRYSIVVENGRENWYFSEKLIDCISQGTVPIYWGCPDIGRFFDMNGIIPFSSLRELANILDNINVLDYERRRMAIDENLRRARQYRCAEDWIYKNYAGVFDV